MIKQMVMEDLSIQMGIIIKVNRINFNCTIGEFINEKASGFGLYIHSNGSVYEGGWLDDSQHGLGNNKIIKSHNTLILYIGIECWKDKSIYKGEYHKGKRHGIGSYCWADGSKYDGEWSENNLHGFVIKFDLTLLFIFYIDILLNP